MEAHQLKPADDEVRQRVSEALRRSGAYGNGLQMRELWWHPNTGQHSSVFGVLDGHCHERIKLFCKFGEFERDSSFGHRGGVAYEAQVYEKILEPLGISTPRFLGSHIDGTSGESWIFLECLENNIRVHMGVQPMALCKAAEWIGSFHGLGESVLRDKGRAFLKSYDHKYYKGWAVRTAEFAKPYVDRFTWLPEVCQRFVQAIPELLASPQTIVHGEYYPHNVQLCGDEIRPIDWESAATAAGEVDLAAIMEFWPESIQQQCEHAYRRARWPEGEPRQFQRRLELARLYICFRWLGEDPEWPDEGRMDQVYLTAKRLGWCEGV